MVLAFALIFPFLDASIGLGMMNPVLRILTSVMLALGLNIVVGFAGLLDLGYVAFWAIGAYVVGWFASGQFSTVNIHLFDSAGPSIPGIHISIWILFGVAMVVTAAFGVLLGAPTLRLRGDYLAIVTLGFGEIVPQVFQNGDSILGHNLTNGTRGISGLDSPSLGGASVDNMFGLGWGTWGPINLLPWYYLGIALVCVCWYISSRMHWSKLGRAWIAIREDEVAASAMGIPLVSTKLWAYGIGAALGGLAGVYHGARIGSIFPASFQFYISIGVLCMVIVGGMGNIWGAIVGAIAIEGLNFWLLPSLTTWGKAAGLNVDFSSYNLLIFGVLLVLMMLYRPQGLIPAKARTIDLEKYGGADEEPPIESRPAMVAEEFEDAMHGHHISEELEHEIEEEHAREDVAAIFNVPGAVQKPVSVSRDVAIGENSVRPYRPEPFTARGRRVFDPLPPRAKQDDTEQHVGEPTAEPTKAAKPKKHEEGLGWVTF
jgi:branched-chain amino acid transport system permease protein